MPVFIDSPLGLEITKIYSGMCSGGRIVDHIENGIENSANDILFAGYQAKGTLGRKIKKYSKRPNGYVYVNGRKKVIRADVHGLAGYSAHADQKGLVRWVEKMPERPGKIKFVHGEGKSMHALALILENLGHRVEYS